MQWKRSTPQPHDGRGGVAIKAPLWFTVRLWEDGGPVADVLTAEPTVTNRRAKQVEN